jgi:hypothetical protein
MILTEDAQTLGHHTYRVGIGFEYLRKQTAPSPLLSASLYKIGMLAIHSGVAENVDFDLDWRGGLIGVRNDNSSVSDWGDLTVATKINFIRETVSMPAISVRNSVKLPNTKYHSGQLGSNEMDYFSYVLVAKQWSGWQTRLNIGFGIIGDPRAVGNQDDVYTLALAAIVSLGETTMAFTEVSGLTGYQDHDEKIVVRAGVGTEWSGLRWNLYGSGRIYGNNRDFATAFELSETWGIGVLIQHQFKMDLFGQSGAEAGDQKSEVRGQRSEVRGQKGLD